MTIPSELIRNINQANKRLEKLEKWEGAGSSGGSLSVLVIASEDLTAGNLIDIWNDGGTAKARKASASLVYEAVGFVTRDVTSGDNARVYLGGLNNFISGATPGETLYISTTAGGVVSPAPNGSGQLVQEVGVAVSATSMVFQPKISILLN